MLLLPAVIVLAAGAFLMVKRTDGERNVPPALDDLDGDLCALEVEGVPDATAYLVDLRKPVADAQAPGRMLRDIGRQLAAGEELRVFALTANPAAPKRLLGRFCKPYDETALNIQADKGQGGRDCDDPPAQISKRVRALAAGFCARRDALKLRLDELVGDPPMTVTDAYLIEALEDIAARRVFVFSDMLQHAPWYSHLDLRWTRWSYAAFGAYDAARERSPATAVSGAGRTAVETSLRVVVFYPLRARVTDALRPRHAHQLFWRDYLAERRGAQVVFEELPVEPGYRAARLMPPEGARSASPPVAAALEDGQALEAATAVEPPPASPVEPAAVEQPESDQANSARAKEPAGGGGARDNGARDNARDRDRDPETTTDPVASAPRLPEATPSPTLDAPTNADSQEATLAPPQSPPQLAVEPPRDAAEPRALPPPEVALRPGAAVPIAPVVPSATPTPRAEAPAPPCPVALKPRFQDALEPGGYANARRVDYGAGVVTVRYRVNRQGEPFDVAVDSVTPARTERMAGLLADTVAEVRGWEFSLLAATPGECDVERLRRAVFSYQRKCVALPMPSCWTVREHAALR